jgi:hypothetical protein
VGAVSLWTSLEPASATVDPGGSTRVRLRLRNTGDIVDEYRFEPVGPIAPWTTVEPPTLRLYPGTTRTVELTFAPPRTPDAVAGPNPYAIRVTPTEHPEATTVPEGNLTITPFTEVRAELVPQTVKGRFRGRPRLAVDNLGNTKLTASINGNDTGDHLSYEIHPGNVQIEPGRAAFVKTTLKPRSIIWFGGKEQRPYTLNVLRSGANPLPVEGTYVQRGFLPRWLATCFGVLTALAVTFVVLWTAYKPAVVSAATEKPVEAGSTLAPSQAPAPALSPAPRTEPAPAEGAPEGGGSGAAGGSDSGGSGGGGGGGGGKQNPPPVVPAEKVQLRDAHTAKCAGLDGSEPGEINENVVQETCAGGEQGNQLWNLEVKYPKLGPGGRPLFQIRDIRSRFCMDLADYGAQPLKTPVALFNCDGTTADNQLWWIDKQQSGAYWIRNYASDNKCLNVEGYADHRDGSDDSADGARITIFDCSNTDDQEWEIVPSQS